MTRPLTITRASLVAARFGELLVTARKQARLRQADLAQAVGYSRASIANMETGRQEVSLSAVYAIAEALGVHPTSLLPKPRVRVRCASASEQKATGG